MTLTQDIRYLGVNDRDIDLFEGQYAVPNGISYNSYVILDEKVAVLDTVDHRKSAEFLANLERELAGRKVDYLVLEPFGAGSRFQRGRIALRSARRRQLVGNAKTFQMLPQFFDVDLSNVVKVKEGDVLSLGRHELHFVMAPMVHWPEVMMTYRQHGQGTVQRGRLWQVWCAGRRRALGGRSAAVLFQYCGQVWRECAVRAEEGRGAGHCDDLPAAWPGADGHHSGGHCAV